MTAPPPPPIFQVGHLERVPLGTPYPGIVAHVGRLLAKLPGNPELVIDFTGVGRPVFDMFVYSVISPTGVLITGGKRPVSTILKTGDESVDESVEKRVPVRSFAALP